MHVHMGHDETEKQNANMQVYKHIFTSICVYRFEHKSAQPDITIQTCGYVYLSTHGYLLLSCPHYEFHHAVKNADLLPAQGTARTSVALPPRCRVCSGVGVQEAMLPPQSCAAFALKLLETSEVLAKAWCQTTIWYRYPAARNNFQQIFQNSSACSPTIF